ncbi:hypothetical protein I4U23_023035 [Adineta vaga]|nr:hypothetical protein I4U23_023035 [Adineta vaga]
MNCLTNREITVFTVFCLLSGAFLLFFSNYRDYRTIIFPLSSKFFSISSNRSSLSNSTLKESRWRTNRLVIIPAMYREIDWYKKSTWPLWLQQGLDIFNTSPSRPYDIYLYQRFDPESKPPFNWPYCQNVHEEAGVYLKFIYDFYHDLPDKMLFIHGKPEKHGLYPIEAAQCIRDDVFYANVNNIWIGNRPWIAGIPDPVDDITFIYKCAVRLLGLLDFDGELQLNPTNHIRKDMSTYSTMCCAQFYVRKERIHHYTYEQWSTLYNASIQPYCTNPRDREIPGTNLLKTFGGAMEFLWHIILGFESTTMPEPRAKTNTDLCHLFRSSCFGSLCNAAISGIQPLPF